MNLYSLIVILVVISLLLFGLSVPGLVDAFHSINDAKAQQITAQIPIAAEKQLADNTDRGLVQEGTRPARSIAWNVFWFSSAALFCGMVMLALAVIGIGLYGKAKRMQTELIKQAQLPPVLEKGPWTAFSVGPLWLVLNQDNPHAALIVSPQGGQLLSDEHTPDIAKAIAWRKAASVFAKSHTALSRSGIPKLPPVEEIQGFLRQDEGQ